MKFKFKRLYSNGTTPILFVFCLFVKIRNGCEKVKMKGRLSETKRKALMVKISSRGTSSGDLNIRAVASGVSAPLSTEIGFVSSLLPTRLGKLN
jgi:hypothetical protein